MCCVRLKTRSTKSIQLDANHSAVPGAKSRHTTKMSNNRKTKEEFDVIAMIQKFLSQFDMDIESRIRMNGRHVRPLELALVMVIWLWMTTTATISIVVRDDQPRLAGMLADVGFYTEPIGYRAIGNFVYHFAIMLWFLMLQNYFFDDYHWLRRANSYFHQLAIQIDQAKMLGTIRKMVGICYWFAVSFGIMMVLFMIMAQLQDADGIIATNSNWWARCYIVAVIMIQAFYSAVFCCKFYVVCRICILTTERWNHRMRSLIRHYKSSPDTRLPETQMVLLEHLMKFSVLNLMIQNLKIYLNHCFAIMLSCLVAISVPVFYSILFTDVLSIQILLMIMLIMVLTIFLVCCKIAGSIDSEAKLLRDPIYEIFVLNLKKTRNLADGQFAYEVIKYFTCVDRMTIGIELMNNPVNADSALKFLTFLFTILAIVLKDRVVERK